MSLYTLNNIRKTFGAREVLNIPELIIEKGEINALLGANGTGKTTLLNLLAFLDIPTSGEIIFSSSPVHFVEKKLKILRRNVILLDQNPILFSTTVYKNLEFGLIIHKVKKSERKRRIEDALKSVGMANFSVAPATSLSGGEAQRVAIARVLVLQPEVILFDEPTSNVDRENQAIIIDLLRELNTNQNISIIFSTHDPNISSSLAHRTISLDHGSSSIVGMNVFSCTLLNRNDKPIALLPCGLELTLPKFPQNRNFLIRVKPTPLDYSSADQNHERNVTEGEVQEITLGGNDIHIKIKAGNLFTVLLTKEEYQKKSLAVGQTVCLHFPIDSIKVLEK